MKFKYQQGGTFVPPFVVYLPHTTPARTEKTDKKEKDDNDVLKEIMSLFKGIDGLPGDIKAVSSKLTSLFSNIERTLETGTGSIARYYVQALTLASSLKTLKLQFDKARDTSIANGGINEYAINSQGLVLTATDNGFEWATPEDIFENSEYYQPITNGQLLDYRYNGAGGLAFNNLSLTTVSNSLGIEGVTKMISSAIAGLGSSTTQLDGYFGSSRLIKGLEDYTKAIQSTGEYDATVDDLYKASVLTLDLRNQANQAMLYIYNTLPTVAKSLLKMKSNGTEEGAFKMMQSLIVSKLTNKQTIDLEMKKGTDSDTALERDFVTSVQAGFGGHESLFKINNSSDISMSVLGTTYELIKTPSGDYVDKASVNKMLNESGLKSITNLDKSIYLGNQRIDIDTLDNVAWDGNGISRVNLPVDESGAPNFKLLEEFEKAQSEFLLSGRTDADRKRIFNNRTKYPNMYNLITQDGKLDMTKFAPFMLVNGITTDRFVEVSDKNAFVRRVEQTPDIVKRFKDALAEKVGSKVQYPEVDEYGLSELLMPDFINSSDQFYKATIYIPVVMNKNAAALGGNQDLKIKESNYWETEYLNRNYVPGGDISILNN